MRAYNVDFVCCIEATSNMAPIAKEVNDFLKSFVPENVEVLENDGRKVLQTRVKIILFRDFACCSQPMVESKFFVYPEEKDELNFYIDNIEYRGGYGYCNALEAIALALKSDWITNGDYRRRHCIYVFSNGKVRPLGGKQCLLPHYPTGMPVDLAELGIWWEGRGSELIGSYSKNAGRLITFVPHDETWTQFESWNRYMVAYTGGKRCCDVDMQTIYDVIWSEDFDWS